MSHVDAELLVLVKRWPALTDSTRKAITALVSDV